MSVYEALVDFVFPKECVGCGNEGEDLCLECWRGMALATQICPMCGKLSSDGWSHKRCKKKDGMEGLVAIWSHEDEIVRKVVGSIKYGFNRELVRLLLDKCSWETGHVFDIIVPVPLYWYRENWRGFNQAELTGGYLATRIGVPLVKALERVKNTPQQARIKNKELRIKSVENAFTTVLEVKNKKILLVDDVFTSGASMRECAKELKKAGAKEVWGFVLAR